MKSLKKVQQQYLQLIYSHKAWEKEIKPKLQGIARKYFDFEEII